MTYQQLGRSGIQQLRTCANAIRRIQTGSKRRAEKILPSTSISRSCYTKSVLHPQIQPSNEDLSIQLCGTVAASLNGAGVGNVLWGTTLQTVYTVPTIILELSFLVAGNQLQKAVTALESKRFLLCRNKSCRLNAPRDCQALSFDNPHAHFHLDMLPGLTLEHNFNLKLYTMEDKLWELPISERGVNVTDGASNNIIFANDASLITGTVFQGPGRFPDSISGVRIPTLHRYVEALILLALREPRAFSTSFWVSELVYMLDLVKMERLGHPAFRQFCDRVIRGASFKPMIQQAHEALGHRIRNDTHWNDAQGIRATWEEGGSDGTRVGDHRADLID